MGDAFQLLAGVDVSRTRAADSAAAVRDYLVINRIIAADLTDCGLAGWAHAPGDSAEEACAGINGTITGWRSTVPNGVTFEVRSHPIGRGGPAARCAGCDHEFGVAGDDIDELFFVAFDDALSGWRLDADDGWLVCPKCSFRELVDRWEGLELPLATELAITFWNWPRLSLDFVAGCGRVGEVTFRRFDGKV